MGLHADALARLSNTAGKAWSDDVQTVLLLGSHSFNVFVATIGSTCRGEFDTVPYYMRGMHDAVSLLSVCARSTSHAKQWPDGSLKPSDARKLFVAVLRDAGLEEMASQTEAILLENAKIANDA